MYEAIDALFKSEPYVYPHTYLNGHMIMEALMLDHQRVVGDISQGQVQYQLIAQPDDLFDIYGWISMSIIYISIPK